MQILPLTGEHDREQFDCGREELNLWLQRIARQHQEKGLSRTYVAVDEAAPTRILGYYALTLTEIDATDLPRAARKRFPRRIPGVRLGRLAVGHGIQGKGIGSLLLVDAIERARRVRREAGSVGLFVDAIDAAAAGFYLRYGFSASPGNPLLLFLPVS
jgi:GNAT superfamily N-acetyltransferase